MNKLNIILLSVAMFLTGLLLGWQVRGSQDSTDLDAKVEQRLNHYLVAGINSGLITINDEMLFPKEEPAEEPTVPATEAVSP